MVRDMKNKLDNLQKQVQPKDNNVSKGNEEIPHQVVQIAYDNDEYLQLPIDPLIKNKDGKTIAQILYGTEQLRQKRLDFQKQRRDFIDAKPNFPGLYLSKYKLIIDEEAKRLGVEVNEKQFVRM